MRKLYVNVIIGLHAFVYDYSTRHSRSTCCRKLLTCNNYLTLSTRSCRDPETAVIHFCLPGGVRHRPQRVTSQVRRRRDTLRPPPFLPCDAMRCTVFVIVILSVCLSVCPSVRPSVTLVDCVHMVRPTIVISSPYGSPIILVSGDITIIPKFEGGHPERGR